MLKVAKLNLEKKYPKITVIVPVYNEGEFLEDTLTDIMNFDYPEYDVYISDNASTDKTPEICKEFQKNYVNIRYFRQDVEIKKNIAFLIDLVETEYFAFFSGNNRIEKSYLKKCMDRLLENPKSIYANSDLRYLTSNGELIKREYTSKDNPDMSGMKVVDRLKTIVNLNAWYFSYGVYKTEIKRDLDINFWNFFNHKPLYGADVTSLTFQLLTCSVEHVNEPLYSYRYKHKNEQDRHDSFIGTGVQLNFPSAEMTLNMVSLVKESETITEDERSEILKEFYKSFSSSHLWQSRFDNYSFLDYYDINNLSEKRKKLLNKLPFHPSELFLKERRVQKDSKRPKIAIFEFNHYHDQVMPSTVSQFNKYGYDVDVYMKDEATYDNKIWECFPNLKCNIHIIEEKERDYSKFIYWIKAFKLIEYEFSIINSLEPEGIFDFIKHLPGRHFSILHNPSLMMQNPKWQEYYNSSLHKHLFIHPMVVSKLPELQHSPWIPPFLKIESVEKLSVDESITRFVVNGSVLDRRNYVQLLETVPLLYKMQKELPKFEVHIVGNSDNSYAQNLISYVSKQPWKDLVFFTSEELSYPDFYSKIAASDFSLFLLDRSDDKYFPYFEDKLTSSAIVTFMLDLPAIMHEEIAELYGLSGITYNDEPDGLLQSMVYALRLPKEQHTVISKAIASEREKVIEESAELFKNSFDILLEDKLRYYQQEALLRIKGGDSEGAIQICEKLLDILPNHTVSLQIMATAYTIIKDFDKAIDLYILAYEQSSSAEIRNDIINLMKQANDPRLEEWVQKV
jgi:glycosyltransferase involved in cell wall biosynthesis/tetratricopeptide (TPR) repeat protein